MLEDNFDSSSSIHDLHNTANREQSSGSVRRVDAGRWREGDGASTSDARERRAGEGASAEVLCERVRWLCEDCRMVVDKQSAATMASGRTPCALGRAGRH